MSLLALHAIVEHRPNHAYARDTLEVRAVGGNTIQLAAVLEGHICMALDEGEANCDALVSNFRTQFLDDRCEVGEAGQEIHYIRALAALGRFFDWFDTTDEDRDIAAMQAADEKLLRYAR